MGKTCDRENSPNRHLSIDVGQPGVDLGQRLPEVLGAHDNPRRVAVAMPYHVLGTRILAGTELY